MADPNVHAGTIDDPIPQQLLYKNAKDGKIYTVAGAASSSSAPAPKVENANETTKGITKLSDAIDSDSDAATGVTAATPKAVKDALEAAKAYTDANGGTTVVDATDTTKGVSKLSDATDSALDASTGKTAATPKAVKDAMNVAKLALAQAGGVVTPDAPPKVELPGTIIEVATDKKIGTVKLSDATNSSSDAATGKTAASSKAVMEAMDKAKEALRVAQAGGGGQIVSVEDATNTVKGIVSLSDATDSELDAATGKFAATPKAVKAAMDKANEALALAGGNPDGNPIEGTKIESATDTKLGVSKLSDETASNADAATGTTAATPKAVMKAYDLANKAFKLAEANAGQGQAGGGSIALPDDADATTKGVVKLSDAVNSDSDVDGLTAATPKAIKTALEQAKAYADTLGGTGTSADATDTVKGINKLSDALDSDLNAATGATAATPLAVKQVNTKVTTLEQTSQDHGNRLDALESGGSGGGGLSYVVTPKILTPTNGAVGQNTKITITGSGYENVFPTDARKHRIFELSKAQDFGTKLETKEADADSIKFDTQLDSQTKYYARIKDVSQKEYRSNWSPVVEFTTGDVTHANTPVITLKGFADSPTDIGSGLTIEGGAYSVNDSSADTHKATSWSIRLKSGRANVWESLNDTTNKISIEVPKGTLQKSTAYVVTVIYHSTNFNDSSPAEHEFTTSNDFGTVQAPVITISGEPNKILETPRFSGGVFSCTRDPDTHESTEIQVIKSQDQSTVWTHTAGGTTSVTIPKGKLTVSTQYKVKMRYKGAAYGWSAWTEKDFTTAAKFTRYLYIGVPGTSTFGVGLATKEIYQSIAPNGRFAVVELSTDPNDMNYGTYHMFDEVSTVSTISNYYLKCIPKFYFAYLQKDRDGTNLNDSELDALLPYVEVTKEQMKEAQRRSPYNAIVIAPADAFIDRNEAQQHGFILPRGFIDGGKEKPCFFIANSMLRGSSYRNPICGHVDLSNNFNLIRCDTPVSGINAGSTVEVLDRYRLGNVNLTSIFAWSAICLISLAQGQYATSTNDCAWYDASLQTNYPKGINNINADIDDSTVRINTGMDDSTGDAFVDKSVYAKTTHNGSINGITHVNGWLLQPTIGVSGLGDGNYILKESVALKDITSSNVENKSLYDKVSFDIPNGSYWGKTNKSSLFHESSGEKWALIGAFSDHAGVSLLSSVPTEFGKGYHYRNTDINAKVSLVGGSYIHKENAGIFSRLMTNWSNSSDNYGARLMAYPNEMVTVTATADYEGAEPKKQTIKVPSGTSDTDVKSQLAVPVSDKYRFKEWQKA